MIPNTISRFYPNYLYFKQYYYTRLFKALPETHRVKVVTDTMRDVCLQACISTIHRLHIYGIDNQIVANYLTIAPLLFKLKGTGWLYDIDTDLNKFNVNMFSRPIVIVLISSPFNI